MKKVIYFVSLVLIVSVSIGVYLFNKKPLDTRQAKPEYRLSAKELVQAFEANEEEANKKFLDKIILVTGSINEIKIEETGVTIFLDSGNPLSGITCSFYSDEASSLGELTVNQTVSIKGKCTGKLMDVVINNCSLSVEKK